MEHLEATEWLHRFAADHHGIVCGDAARAAGIPRRATDQRVARGSLVRLCPTVFRVPGHPVTWRSRLWAALVEAGPGSVAGLRSAGRLHELWRYRNSDAIEVVKVRGSSHKATLGRLHETSRLDAAHVELVDGFPCTTLARTVFDLLGDPDHRPLRSPAATRWHEERMLGVVNDAMRHHGLTPLVELAVIATIAGRGRSGSSLARKIFGDLSPDYVPEDSHVETVFAVLLSGTDVPSPTKQLRIEDNDGLVGIVDFAWPRQRVVVEIDSSFHDGPLDRRSDQQRDERLRALGYTVLRFRWTDLVTDRARVLRLLRAALQASNLR